MTLIIFEYSLLLTYIGVSSLLSLIIFIISYVFANQQGYTEKLSPYECGFDPFEDARNQFDIRFYLTALIFLVFDLETSFLFPWAMTLNEQNFFGFWVIGDFFFELVVGFFYSWRVGALEWE